MSSRIHTFWSILFLLVILNSAVYAATVQLPATGQIKCYDPGSYSELPTCAGTGQDGELQSGLAWNAATRFTNNNNGTITDNLTGLIWLHDGNCTATLGGVAKTGGLSWNNAITWSNNLASGSCGLTDGSIAGQWRMPNINELKSLIASGQPGYFSWLNSYGFTNTDRSLYWASNSSEYAANNGSAIEAQSGSVRWNEKSSSNDSLFYVLPVRSGTPGPDAPVIRTGATTSYATGDDGSVQAGVQWPNPRFSDNGNGTLMDNLTGLVWLKNALCTDTAGVEKTSGTLTWADALTWSNNLANGKCGLTDGSTPGDWRLPNSNEIFTLANLKYYNLIDWLTPQGFTNVIQSEYWTSSTLEHYNDPSAAHAFSSWMMYLYPRSKPYEHFPVLPVRNEAFRFDSLLVYAALRFGTLSVNTTSAPKEVLIRNTDTVNAKQLTISLIGLNPTEFSVVAGGTNSCSSLTPTLAAGASCTIQVTSHPTTAGAKTAYLRVATAAGHKDIPVTTDTTHDGVCGSANGQTFVDAPTSGLCTVGAPSSIPSGAGPWSWTCNSTNGGSGSETCSATQLQTHTVTATAGTGGSISCVPTTVAHGSSSVCTVTVNSGYSLNTPVGGSCGGALSGDVSPYTFTTSAITGNCSVAANFTYTLNGSCGSANNQFFVFPPTDNLCANGTPPVIPSGTGPWSWTCNTSICKAAQSYVDADNGTVVDIINNLTWLQTPGCFPRQDWNTAMASSANLASGSCGLSDYSSAGNWHLLSLDEMNTLINSQAPKLGLFHNAVRDDWYYWTSSSYSSTLAYIGWFFSYSFEAGAAARKTDTDYVWPVRSGQFWSYDSLAITAALQFGTQLVGVPSTPKEVVIKNTGASAKSFSVSLTGGNASDFSVAGGGATPCSSLSPTLAAGASCTLQVTANTTGAGLKLAGLRFTTTNGSRDLPVSAVSQQYSVTPTAGTGGGISCTPTTLSSGGVSTCTITVDSTHVLNTPVGGSCGGVLSGSESPYTYTTNPVTANCTVDATFSAPVLAGTCGSANTQAFLSAPTSGLCATGMASVTPSGTGPWSWVCNGLNGGAASGTCSANQLYTVTPTSHGGGSLVCNAATVIKDNSTTCTITANSGFVLNTPVGGTCGGSLSGSASPYSYTTSAINDNCTVDVTFGRIVTGACGNANHQSFFSAPTTGFCATGAPSVIPVGTGPSWSWTCNGSNGGANSGTCTASQILSNPGNGTITDSSNGLIWLKNADCFAAKTWNDALSAANTLASGACGLNDSSSVGDWRLPTIDEQRLASDSGLRYYTMNGAGFTGVQPDYYWSSTAYSGDSNTAWRVNMVNGFVSFGNKSDALRVWPVRSGPLTFDSLTISGSLNFGVLSIGSTSPPHIITIHNSSSTISKSFSAAITGANASEFSVAPGGGSSCGSLNPTLAPNTSCTVQVTASPVITGTKSASLTITTSGGSRNMSITASTPENGSCGSANNQAFPDAPSTNLCTKGVPSPVPSGVGPWSWVCNGTNGGTNSGSCKAIPTLVDAGNGTIVDTANSLTWLKKADCYVAQPYDNAATVVSTLANGTCGLTDGSTTGTWRQPTIKELQKLPDSGMRYTNFNAAGFTGVQPFKYWSSTMQDLVGCVRYYVNMLDGNVSYDNKLYSFNVWPVKPGQIWTHDSLVVNASLQFGSLSVGTTSPPKEVLIRNSAGSSKTFSVAITGDNATEFSVTAGGTSSCGTLTPTLAAGASCTVQVTATPTSVGIKSGHLTLTTSAGGYSIPATVSGSNGSQSITFSNPGTVTVGATKPLIATASSGLTVVFSSLTPAFCSVNASTVTGVASGSCTIAADQAGNNNFAPADRVIQSFTVAVPATLTVTISGNGSVTSQNQSGINYTCNSGTCAPVTFATGDTVTLTATGSNSSFNAWSGNYTGTNNPSSIMMTGNKAVTASFTPGTATVKIDDDNTAYYSINSALAIPTQDATIQARDTSFTENVTMENSHTLTLKGGYSDSTFSSQTGYSTINGSLTISSGTLVVDRIVVGP